MRFHAIAEAITAIKRGRVVIVCDDRGRENEADLIFAAEKVNPQKINFMAREGRGLICVAMLEERLRALKLSPMVQENTERFGTGFTVSCDAKHGTTTGISAFDRAKTVRALIRPKTKPEDLTRPGHLFPLRAYSEGVLRRAGHTEAALDLARLAGFYPAGVICEIVGHSGHMAKLPEVFALAKRFRLPVITIADLIGYRKANERVVERVAEANLPTRFGVFRAIVYQSLTDRSNHVALVHGEMTAKKPVLVRVHSRCLTGDSFGSLRCDCGEQLTRALRAISRAKGGVFLYMNQEGRGIGLGSKFKAYALQDRGLDTVEANRRLGFPPDLRDYGIGAQILSDLGVRKMRLLTNNPRKVVGIEGYGLEIVSRVPLAVRPNGHNRKYLATKQRKLGHLLNVDM